MLSKLNIPLTITATGMVLPNNIITSEMIDKRLGKPLGYVESRSGIKQRYHVTNDQSQSSLASQAVKRACSQGGFIEQDIDLLIAVQAVPEQVIPCTASMILNKLGWSSRIGGFDINASCIGILPALISASSMINQGLYRRIVIVASEVASRGLDWQDEDSSYIFGDGACALVVEGQSVNSAVANSEIIAYELQTFGNYYDMCQIRIGTSANPTVGMTEKDFYFTMQGKELFKVVAEYFEPFLDKVLQQAGLNKQDIDLWIPHQASHLGLTHMIMRMGIDAKKVINIYEDYGNQVSASLPTALHIARESGQLKQGQTVVLLGTGAGVSFGALVWKL